MAGSGANMGPFGRQDICIARPREHTFGHDDSFVCFDPRVKGGARRSGRWLRSDGDVMAQLIAVQRD
jgi:hypothetical protein